MTGRKFGSSSRVRSFDFSRLFVTTQALALASALALAPPQSRADVASTAGEASADRTLLGGTDQLLERLAQFERAPTEARSPALVTLTQQAQRRQGQLLDLLQKNPRLAIARMMPRGLRERLPAQAAAYVEQEVALQGSVRAQVADDIDHGASHTSYAFLPGDGSRALDLHFADPGIGEREIAKWLNKRLTLKAMRIGDQLALADRGSVRLAAYAPTATGSTGTTGIATASTTVGAASGNQNTLVIMANFSDLAVACTVADVQSRLFGSGGSTVNQDFFESTGGLVSFSGKVIGPVALNVPSTGSCDPNGWASTLDAAARSAGADPAGYTRVSYVMPKNPNCPWSGLASIGGTAPTPSWIQVCGATGLIAHELGHNLGLDHAMTPTAEYGDRGDPMGGSMLVQFNAANRVMAGWMPASQTQDVAVGGSYALGALEVAGATSPRVLRLPKADTGEVYYVALRQLIGIDANLMAGFQNTVTVHRATGALPAVTTLLAAIAPGQSWVDSVNGIQIVNQGVAGSIATVGVTMGTSSCARTAPAISVTPGSQTGSAGATLNYVVSITNRNSAACPNSSFSLAQTLPAGLSGVFLNPSLTLAPGASMTTNWAVVSAASQANATYALSASVTDASSGLGGTAPASLIVYTAPICTRSAPSVSVSPSSQSSLVGATVPYTVTIVNRNSAACGNSSFGLSQVLPSGFSGAFGNSSLSIAPGAGASSTWNVVAAGTAGTYTLTTNAVDATTGMSGQAQALETVTATTPATSDITPPTLVFTGPASGAVLSGRNATLTATASDASGIASVAFFVDGNLLSSGQSVPYSANWNLRKAGAGTHTLTVRATDGAGNVREQSVTVSVVK